MESEFDRQRCLNLALSSVLWLQLVSSISSSRDKCSAHARKVEPKCRCREYLQRFAPADENIHLQDLQSRVNLGGS